MSSRWITIVLASTLLSGKAFAAQITGTPFPDVPADHPNFEAIDYLRENNVIQGYPDGTFGPERRINRAEFVKILTSPYVMDGVRVGDCLNENVTVDDDTVFFTDVPRDAWFAAPVCAAKISGLVDGYPDFSFKPDRYINFVEAAKIVTGAFAGILPSGTPWYEPYVMKLDELNAIPVSIQGLDVMITRGEMAEMLYRLVTDTTTKRSLMYGDLK